MHQAWLWDSSFLPISKGQDLAIQSHLTSKETKKCSLALGPEERETSVVSYYLFSAKTTLLVQSTAISLSIPTLQRNQISDFERWRAQIGE
jgi:hypothetical protein